MIILELLKGVNRMKKYMIIIICISIVCICSCNYIDDSKYPMPDEISVVLESTAENSCSEEIEPSVSDLILDSDCDDIRVLVNDSKLVLTALNKKPTVV